MKQAAPARRNRTSRIQTNNRALARNLWAHEDSLAAPSVRAQRLRAARKRAAAGAMALRCALKRERLFDGDDAERST